VVWLNIARGDFYLERSLVNVGKVNRVKAPRGLIVDSSNKIVADNFISFSLVLNTKDFLKHPEKQKKILEEAEAFSGVSQDNILKQVERQEDEQLFDDIVLAHDLSQEQVIALQTNDRPIGLELVQEYKRSYPEGKVFASLLGYTSAPTIADLKNKAQLVSTDEVGRTGIESFYDERLQGKPGVVIALRNARGEVLENQVQSEPRIAPTLHLTIDGELQSYFYKTLDQRLKDIGRTSAVGIAIDVKTGAVLAFMNFPSFDNNIFSTKDEAGQRQKLLNDHNRPLFDRAVSGLYNPGSTIKPMVGIAALNEKIISPSREIFSPGYLEIPNPYHPENPSKFLDWRYQGNVNLGAAIAQSSNVYFYAVGGGALGIKGLGIGKLRQWWQKFGLGKKTGIDMPGEEDGFLPDPDWKQKTQGRPWLLGDTYNVSIGQGDLLLTPMQLAVYAAGLANGGKFFRPYVSSDNNVPAVNIDLSYLKNEFREVQKGMRQTVTSPLGTAKLLDNLPMATAAKTGSAQIKNNTQENAFFIGYAPYENPQIAIMVMIENSKEGSLNAVPVARDVFSWYYENRVKKVGETVKKSP
jgi:penicillin-binding protein 2